MITSSTARNIGRRKLAITRKNSPAITSRIATNTTNDTMRDTTGLP
jgi:hypothetical protein